MELLYSLNIAAYLLTLLITPLYLSRRFRLGAWNLLTIPLLVSIPLTSLTSFSGPYFVLPGSLFNPYFQYALLVNNIYVIIQSLTVIILVQLLLRNEAISGRISKWMVWSGNVKPPRMVFAAWIFLGLFCVSFLLLTQSFGLLNWIANPRLGYQAHRSGSGQWFAFAITFLSVSLVLATLYIRSTHFIPLLAPVYLYFVSLLGSKGYTLSFGIFLVIMLAIRRYTYLKPAALIIGAGAAGTAISIFTGPQGGFGLKEISEYSDYYVNAAMYYQGYLQGQVSLFHGDVTLSSLWALVPRGLYPDKPYVYGNIKIDELFYPGAAQQTNTPAFATVDKFSDFGWPQVVVSGLLDPQSFVNALLYVVVLPRLNALNIHSHIPHGRLLTYCFLIMNAPFFLMYFTFPLYQIMLLLILGIIHLANQVRISKARDSNLAPSVSAEAS